MSFGSHIRHLGWIIQILACLCQNYEADGWVGACNWSLSSVLREGCLFCHVEISQTTWRALGFVLGRLLESSQRVGLHPGGFIVFRPMVLGVIEFSIYLFVLGNSLKTELVNFEGKLNFKQVKCILYFIY